MRYLVTGGAGFIGSHLVDQLLGRANDAEVTVLDNLRRGRREFLAAHSTDKRLQIIEGDIRDAELVTACSAGIDTTFHLAAQSNVIGAGHDIAYSVGTNVMGTVNVLDAALRQGVRRLVFTSSREVYGDPAALPVAEDAPLAAKNLYGASKVSGEMYCRAFANQGLDVRILRLANVYGPRDRDRVIPIWLDRARKGADLQIYGGRQVLDLIWVGFIVRALIAAAEAPTFNGPINVGSGKGTRILDLAEEIRITTETSAVIEHLPARPEEVIGYIADIAKLEAELELVPPENPLAGLPEVVASQGQS